MLLTFISFTYLAAYTKNIQDKSWQIPNNKHGKNSQGFFQKKVKHYYQWVVGERFINNLLKIVASIPFRNFQRGDQFGFDF